MEKEHKENFSFGWISLYRNIRNHWIFKNDKHFKWWVIMLFEVNHSENKIVRNYVIYKIKKGQSCNCLRTWGILFNTTPKTVSRFFDLLEKDNMITRSSLGKGKQALTLINISNYNDYQNKGKQGIPQEVNKKETRSKQTLPTNNKGNNENNENNSLSMSEGVVNNVAIGSQYFYETQSDFLKDWNKARTHFEGKPTNIAKLSPHELQDFKSLKNEFEIEQFKEGIRGLFSQKNMFPANRLRPSHFLKDRNIEKYLDCQINKTQLFKDKTKNDRL